MIPSTKSMYSTLKPKRRKRIYIIAAVLLLIIVGAGFYMYWVYKTGLKAVDYSTVKVSIGDVSAIVSASGTLSATNEVEIGSQISGTILDVLVEENDVIKKGDVLAIINPESINQTIERFTAQLHSANAGLKSAEAMLANKEWQYKRLQKLYAATKGSSPSLSDMESAKLDYETSLADIAVKRASIVEVETNLISARIDLKNSIIVSPVDGVVLSRSIDAGQTVAAAYATPKLFTVAENLEKMKLIVNVSEADVGKVREGQKVTFSVDTYPDDTFASTVSRVNIGSTQSDKNIVSYETTIYIDNRNLMLRPGMSATADIETARVQNAILAPVSALFFNPDMWLKPEDTNKVPERTLDRQQGTIWILKAGKPEKVDIRTGVSDGRSVEVTSGNINENDQIITGIRIKKKD